jgi:hypothetical protein
LLHLPMSLVATFATRIAGHDAVVHTPSITLGDGVDAPWLASPRILGRPPMTSQEFWGMVYHGTKEAPIAVAIQHIAFTTEIADSTDLEQEAESVISAMDAWWDNVCSWLEVVTGQHLTQVGHQKTRYIGNPTPVWTLLPDGAHRRPASIRGTVSIQLGIQIHGVTTDIFRDCVALADQAPKLAWILLRDARSLAEADQPRRRQPDLIRTLSACHM